MTEIKITEEDTCTVCKGMGVIQIFGNYPGQFSKPIFQQIRNYTRACPGCGGKPIWSPKPNT